MQRSIKLDLGCGVQKREGFIGVDINPNSDADVICDLEIAPYPFDDDSISEINSDHCIEHLADLDLFLQEIHRICKLNAQVRIVFPHFSRNWHSTQHKRAYGIRLLAHYGHLFDIISVRFNYTWISRRHFYRLPLYLAIDLIDFLANLSPWFCERCWCYWVGGFDNVEIIAKVREHTPEAIKRKRVGMHIDGQGFEENLLQTLICLRCRKNLVYEQEKGVLICQGCGQTYAVRNGVPIMLKAQGGQL